MDYSAEQAGATAERTLTAGSAVGSKSISQDMASGHWAKVVELLIDLRAAMPRLNSSSRRLVVRFMVDGYQPGRVNGRYPDPQALSAAIAEQVGMQVDRAMGEDATVVTILRKELREVHAARALAIGMSGRRAHGAVLTVVDRKLRGRACPRCKSPLRLGQQVFLDRDWHSAWHIAGGCMIVRSGESSFAS